MARRDITRHGSRRMALLKDSRALSVGKRKVAIQHALKLDRVRREGSMVSLESLLDNRRTGFEFNHGLIDPYGRSRSKNFIHIPVQSARSPADKARTVGACRST